MRETKQQRIALRKRLIKEQDNKCAYCGRHILDDQSQYYNNRATLDHVIPVVELDEIIGDENLVVACKTCNTNKDAFFIFTNLIDKIIYPIVDVPYFFKVKDIQSNGYKMNRKGRAK